MVGHATSFKHDGDDDGFRRHRARGYFQPESAQSDGRRDAPVVDDAATRNYDMSIVDDAATRNYDMSVTYWAYISAAM